MLVNLNLKEISNKFVKYSSHSLRGGIINSLLKRLSLDEVSVLIGHKNIAELIMFILTDQNFPFEYLSNLYMAVDFIDILVEKRNQLQQQTKTQEQIDNIEKDFVKFIFKACAFVFDDDSDIDEKLANNDIISVSYLEEFYKDFPRFKDCYGYPDEDEKDL
jgi:hypothetical protein